MHHLNCSTSNHSPLLIIPEPIDSVIPSKPFRFKEMWLTDKDCAQIVKAVWAQHLGIVSKIDNYGVALKKWSSKHFGCVQKELKKKQKLLAQVELVALNTGINFQARMLRREVNDQLERRWRCGFRALGLYGQSMVIEIQSFFTWRQHSDTGGIEYPKSKIHWGSGVRIREPLLRRWQTFLANYTPHQTLANPSWLWAL